MTFVPVVILCIVFFLIAIRQIGTFKLCIWQIMLGGAIAVLFFGGISLSHAIQAINTDVILFLFCMFVVGKGLEESGYLSHLVYKLFKRAHCIDHLILSILFSMGILSAFLTNDTVAIIGTPVMLLLARKHTISPKLLLLTLAFAITIGSVTSPLGNPQNFLIALAMENPFITFFQHLFIPTVINLVVAFVFLKFFYKSHFHSQPLDHAQEPIKDHMLAILSKCSLVIIFFLVFFMMLFPESISLTTIALVAAVPILLSKKRWCILQQIDWATLVFFAAMFVLMQAVWNTGFFQQFFTATASLSTIFLVSILVSQFISNVPLVALYLPLLQQAGASAKEFIALAAGSTIAGNLLILGAASNVIIIQNAEKKGETITFWEFAKIGIPLTIVNAFVYWVLL